MSKMILANRSVGKQGPNKNKESMRTELAACAAQFFAQQGYHGTSTQIIAQHCNIRKASLFHHYKTKEEIALAAIHYVQNECVVHIFRHADNVLIDVKQRIMDFLAACEQFFTQRVYSLLPTLLGLELRELKVFAKAINEYFQAWLDTFTRLLLPLYDNVEVARQVAEQSVIRMQGHLVTARIQQDQQQFSILSNELRQLWFGAV